MSNWVSDDVDGGFPVVVTPSPWKGLTQLHEMLQQQGRFPEALSLLMAEVKFVSEFSLLKDLREICDAMETKGDPISMMDVADARISFAEMLAAKGKVGEANIEFAKVAQVREGLVRDIGQESIKYLDYCIEVATFTVNPPNSAEQRRARFLKFATTHCSWTQRLLKQTCQSHSCSSKCQGST